MQRPPSQQVHVHMKHRLSRARTHIEHSPIAVFNRALPGNLRRRQMTLAHQIGVFGLRFFQAGNVFLGNDQHMSWGLWVDIVKGQRVFVLIHFLRRYLTTNNATKQTISHSAVFHPVEIWALDE
jgi:hypothetical protein